MPSNARWTAFDYTESRLGGRERHVEGRDRLAETFQGQAAEVFQRNRFFDCGCDAATYQYLAVLGLGAQPSTCPLRTRGFSRRPAGSLEANVQFMTVMATKMPYIGRG